MATLGSKQSVLDAERLRTFVSLARPRNAAKPNEQQLVPARQPLCLGLHNTSLAQEGHQGGRDLDSHLLLRDVDNETKGSGK